MTRIIIETKINAPIERVFDLARSIDLHLISQREKREKIVAGRRRGLINQNEFITFKAKHLGFKQRMTSAITYMRFPFAFVDKMIKGPFKRLEHHHYFDRSDKDGKTIMKDVFNYSTPLGLIGKIMDTLFLKSYLKRVLKKRNRVIKRYAENQEKWMQVLSIY